MKKKSILILGSLSDIAKSIAHKFAKNNYDLLLAARNISELKLQTNDLKLRYNINVDYYEFDILKIEDHLSFINNLRLVPDIVLCAVGYMGKQIDNEENQVMRSQVIRTNFEGPTNIISEFANIFEKRGNGMIVGISSVAEERGRKSNYIYGSAKAGFTTFLSGLRNRLNNKNVHVLTILPGTVYTKMTLGFNLPKLITTHPDKIAEDIFVGVQKKKDIIYTLSVWRYIMKFINFIPEAIFKKTNL